MCKHQNLAHLRSVLGVNCSEFMSGEVMTLSCEAIKPLTPVRGGSHHFEDKQSCMIFVICSIDFSIENVLAVCMA